MARSARLKSIRRDVAAGAKREVPARMHGAVVDAQTSASVCATHMIGRLVLPWAELAEPAEKSHASSRAEPRRAELNISSEP